MDVGPEPLDLPIEYVPMFACDRCGRVVVVGSGMVSWGDDRRVTVTHKGNCDPGLLYWNELDAFLRMLTLNTVEPPKVYCNESKRAAGWERPVK
jgi:hypothetical protein